MQFAQSDYYFQQENCIVHVSKKSLNFFKSAKIKILEWPSMTPDMNIQENIWQIISDLVYDQKQYENIESLWLSIEKAVEAINTRNKETIKSIYDNFNRRLLKIIENKGNAIPY